MSSDTIDKDRHGFRPTHSLPLKTAAVMLLLVTVFVTVISGVGIALSAVYGLYDGVTDEQVKNELAEEYLDALMGSVLADYAENPDTFTLTFSENMPGIRYEILDSENRVLVGNYDNAGYDAFSEDILPITRLHGSDYSGSADENGEQSATAEADGAAASNKTDIGEAAAAEEENAAAAETAFSKEDIIHTEQTHITVRLWANNDVLRGARLKLYRILHLLNSGWKTTAIALCALCFQLSAALSVFLLCSAGRRKNNDGPTEGMLDKIPTDLFAVIVGVIETMIVGIVMDYVVPELNDIFSLAVFVTVLLYIPFMLLLIGFFMSISTRVKVGRLVSNTVIWRVLYGLYRLTCCVFRGLKRFVGRLPLAWRTALGALGVLLVNLFIGRVMSLKVLLAAVIAETVLFGVLAVVYASSLRRVRNGISTIAAGDLASRVDTTGLPPACKSAAEDLNHIGDGLSHAVDERMRSERFKTELITNVSHDIKTPLTSIINYVDLIKKMDIDDETLCGYVDVLDRQSTRLKKLTEDLVEASKAQSGALTVNLAPCELSVLLEQVEGEYAEKLAAGNLRLIVTKPRTELTISADGRHLGRIFDNLMGNILKYAQPGTRVFIDAKPEITPDGVNRAVITFRNTSGAELNIPAEELMERFVRGDASRHTEGSGLGLAIVRSLTELQGGTMNLSIDGDLFKVRLEFPLT